MRPAECDPHGDRRHRATDVDQQHVSRELRHLHHVLQDEGDQHSDGAGSHRLGEVDEEEQAGIRIAPNIRHGTDGVLWPTALVLSPFGGHRSNREQHDDHGDCADADGEHPRLVSGARPYHPDAQGVGPEHGKNPHELPRAKYPISDLRVVAQLRTQGHVRHIEGGVSGVETEDRERDPSMEPEVVQPRGRREHHPRQQGDREGRTQQPRTPPSQPGLGSVREEPRHRVRDAIPDLGDQEDHADEAGRGAQRDRGEEQVHHHDHVVDERGAEAHHGIGRESEVGDGARTAVGLCFGHGLRHAGLVLIS